MKKIDVIKKILGHRFGELPKNIRGSAFAPSNIALVKYWGKRDQELNLPITSSLSISLGKKGAETSLTVHDLNFDEIILNNQKIELDSNFAKKLMAFLNLFRDERNLRFKIEINSNIPIAAGLASSACGFAALVKALNQLYGWSLSEKELSILARLGSGSAARSIWDGFVEWHRGEEENGMDSFGEIINTSWPELCIGLLIMDKNEKSISSREAMQKTVETSTLYNMWPKKVYEDLEFLKQAISQKNFELLGKTAESNALTMHATMLAAVPPINYTLPDTITAIHKIWHLRQQGLPIYFTQDAGPNLKLIFLEKDFNEVQTHFLNLEVVRPF